MIESIDSNKIGLTCYGIVINKNSVFQVNKHMKLYLIYYIVFYCISDVYFLLYLLHSFNSNYTKANFINNLYNFYVDLVIMRSNCKRFHFFLTIQSNYTFKIKKNPTSAFFSAFGRSRIAILISCL